MSKKVREERGGKRSGTGEVRANSDEPFNKMISYNKNKLMKEKEETDEARGNPEKRFTKQYCEN